MEGLVFCSLCSKASPSLVGDSSSNVSLIKSLPTSCSSNSSEFSTSAHACLLLSNPPVLICKLIFMFFQPSFVRELSRPRLILGCNPLCLSPLGLSMEASGTSDFVWSVWFSFVRGRKHPTCFFSCCVFNKSFVRAFKRKICRSMISVFEMTWIVFGFLRTSGAPHSAAGRLRCSWRQPTESGELGPLDPWGEWIKSEKPGRTYGSYAYALEKWKETETTEKHYKIILRCGFHPQHQATRASWQGTWLFGPQGMSCLQFQKLKPLTLLILRSSVGSGASSVSNGSRHLLF